MYSSAVSQIKLSLGKVMRPFQSTLMKEINKINLTPGFLENALTLARNIEEN